jgi:SNF2 family DNA or RNA helicase
LKLYPHQEAALATTSGRNRVAYYHDMGLGKTFVGAEKLICLNTDQTLVVCQKSKVADWAMHFEKYYDLPVIVYRKQIPLPKRFVLIINYDLVWRRPELLGLEHHTLLLDESSLVQNRRSKRSQFVLESRPQNVILLSGTPIGGKYESLWTQCQLLGWPISEDLFIKHFCDFHYDQSSGFPRKIIDGYKNIERLKHKLSQHGAHFLKTEQVLDLPDRIEQVVVIVPTKAYRRFAKQRICHDPDIVGDHALSWLTGLRRLCGAWNKDKLIALADILDSCDERIVIFYNFNEERDAILDCCGDRPVSLINGSTKDLSAYEAASNSVVLVQYQAGAMGLNLQLASRMVFFTLPLSSELYEQAKKRIHRIGQASPCFYYLLLVKDSIEEKIYQTLNMRRDYTDELFRRDYDRNTV